jgi:hypothetical protein
VGRHRPGIRHRRAEDYVLREAADRLGIGFEVQAGEMGPPESITEALDVRAGVQAQLIAEIDAWAAAG